MMPPLPQIEGVEHRYETVNGIRMHYAEAGSGEPLVLVHGWPQHWWMWRDLIGPLAERYRVVAPDLRGHGWSDKPRSTYRKAELLGDVMALLDSLGLERVRFVGHDWGGYLGALAGLQHPERIERLVVMGVPHPWLRTRARLRLALVGTYQLVLAGPWGKWALRHGFLRAMLGGGRSIGSFSDQEREMYESIVFQPDALEATVRIYRSFLLHDLARLRELSSRRLTVPTLWLVGEKDALAGLADEGYRGHADDMTLDRLAGANHFFPEEIPETVLERLRTFL
jgi:pimeloyl-ACP methyl ester carboxylesterase